MSKALQRTIHCARKYVNARASRVFVCRHSSDVASHNEGEITDQTDKRPVTNFPMIKNLFLGKFDSVSLLIVLHT